MDNSEEQPLPPGVHSWPNNSSNSAQALFSLPVPGQVQPGKTRPQYHSNYAEYSQFSWNVPVTSDSNNNTLSQSGSVTGQALTSEATPSVNSTEHQEQNKFLNPVDGGYQIIENTTSVVLQESGVNFAQKVEEVAANVSNVSTKCSNGQMQSKNARDIDAAVQEAVLREQEIATQNIIRSQREVSNVASATKDNLDIFSECRDPNELKEHLLKMATEHRAEMAVKRAKALRPEEGNSEIGNGYGVPGGGAYYGAPSLNTTTGSYSESELHRGSAQKPAAKELPEYLKQKLRARGS